MWGFSSFILQLLVITIISNTQIREARTEGIGECLKKEYRITSHILRNHVSKDYYEVFLSSDYALKLFRKCFSILLLLFFRQNNKGILIIVVLYP